MKRELDVATILTIVMRIILHTVIIKDKLMIIIKIAPLMIYKLLTMSLQFKVICRVQLYIMVLKQGQIL